MRKFFKRFLSTVLVVVMIITMIPFELLSASATNGPETEQDVAYNATNALGEVLEQAIETETDEETGYFVRNVIVEGLTVTVEFTAPDNTTLVVALYDETSNAMLTSGKVNVDSLSKSVEVVLEECSIPEYFVVKAFLLNEQNAPVCKNYEGLEYTAAYQEFLSKTIYDFEGENIVNLDYSVDNNFAVVSDDAIVAEQLENTNILVTNDYENGIYVFENADETITSLKCGDVFHFVYGDGLDEYILTKVGTIEIDGDTVTITTAEEFEISEFFSYIKIDTSKPYEELKTASVQTMANSEDEGFVVENSKEHSIAIDKEWVVFGDDYNEEDTGTFENRISLSCKGELKFVFDVKFYYDAELFKKDYYELLYKTTVTLDGNIGIKGEIKKEFKLELAEPKIPICPGLTADVEVALKFTISAEINIEGGIEFKAVFGAKKITGKEEEDLSEDPSLKLKFKIEGKLSFTITPIVSVGLQVLVVTEIEASIQADFEISATATLLGDRIGTGDIHSCAFCVDGDINLSVSIKVKFKFGLDEVWQETILDFNIFTLKRKLGDFYISFGNNSDGSLKFLDFGWGECPYKFSSEIGEEFENLSGEKARGTCGTNLIWVLYNNGELVIAGNGAMDYWRDTYLIPWRSYKSEIKSVKFTDGVTSISDYAFKQHGKLVSVTIPNSVKTIGKDAFYDCASLAEITIPDSVTTLGDYALYSCDNLKYVTIGKSVTSIGKGVLENSTNLIDITVDEDNRYYSSDEYGVLFNKDKTVLIQYPVGNSRTDYIIPDGVVTIGEQSFHDSKYLTNVVISDTVKTIGGYVFSYSDKLKTVTIGNGVTTIGNSIFSFCYSLESITIPDNVTSIGSTPFLLCKALKTVIIGDGITAIGKEWFSSCESLNSVTFGKNITSIGDYAFEDCYALVRMDIPDGVKTVGYMAFSDCNNLVEVTIPDSVTTIGKAVFSNCDNLSYILIGNGVSSIGDSAFEHCGNLLSITVDENNRYYSSDEYGVLFNKDKTVLIQYPVGNSRTVYYIPDGVISIGDFSFQYSKYLTNVVISDTVKTIGGYVFSYSKELKSVTIGNGVTTIGDSIFIFCYSLERITIPDNVTSMGGTPFLWCNALKTVIIGNGITAIGKEWFSSCESLNSVTFGKNITSIGNYAFENCYALASLDIPDNVKTIGNYAFDYCKNLKYVTIGKGATSISNTAFQNCEKLVSITVDENNEYYSNDEYGVFFNKNKTILIQYPRGNTITNYSLPEGVISIEAKSFYFNKTINNITIPDSVTTIGEQAFYYANNLKTLTIGIGVTTINKYAFSFCNGLTDVYYYGSQEQWSSITIGTSNEELTSATIHYDYGSVATASYMPYSVVRTKAVSSPEVFTASADNSLAGNEYLILVLERIEREIDVSSENLLYIDQKTATSSSVSFNFVPKSKDFGMVVIIGDFGNGNEVVFANEWDVEYTITWNIGEEIISQNVLLGSEIIPPEVAEDEGYYFAGWTPAVPSKMPSKDLTFTAKFADYDVSKIGITITPPESRTVQYRESIVLYANTTNMPEGAKIKWVVDSDDVSIEVSKDGRKCTVTSISNGNAVVTAYIVDANGNVITNKSGARICDKEGIISEVSLWSIIVYAFKQLFAGNSFLKIIFKDLFS